MKLVRLCTNIFVLPSHLLRFNVNQVFVNHWKKSCLTAARVQFAINKILYNSMVFILIRSMSNVKIHHESYSVEIWSLQSIFWYGSQYYFPSNTLIDLSWVAFLPNILLCDLLKQTGEEPYLACIIQKREAVSYTYKSWKKFPYTAQDDGRLIGFKNYVIFFFIFERFV